MQNENMLIDRFAKRLKESYPQADRNNPCPAIYYDDFCNIVDEIAAEMNSIDTVDVVILPCKVGDTVYGKLWNYGEEVHECKVTKSKVCQFRDGTLHYFLDLEFDILDYYYRDGRMMRCHNQAVIGEDYGSWNRVYLSREEAEAALATIGGDENG